MAIYLTQTQIDQIKALYLAGPNAQGNFSHIYPGHSHRQHPGKPLQVPPVVR